MQFRRIVTPFIWLMCLCLTCSAALADIARPKTLNDTLQLLAEAYRQEAQAVSVTVDTTNAEVKVTFANGEESSTLPDNLHRSLLAAESDADRQIILDNFVSALVAAALSPAKFDTNQLRVALRHTDYAALRDHHLVMTPFLGELSLFYVLDAENEVTFVTKEMASQATLNAETIAQIAQSNMRFEGWHMTQLEGGIRLLRFDGFYDASLLLSAEVMQQVSDGMHRVAAVAIARDLVLVGDAMVPGTIETLSGFAQQIIPEQPYPLSAQVMIWDGARWHLR